MENTFTDEDLLTWEAFASTGDFGFPEHSRLIFRCVTDPSRRARSLSREGDKKDVERTIRDADTAELKRLWEAARELR